MVALRVRLGLPAPRAPTVPRASTLTSKARTLARPAAPALPTTCMTRRCVVLLPLAVSRVPPACNGFPQRLYARPALPGCTVRKRVSGAQIARPATALPAPSSTPRPVDRPTPVVRSAQLARILLRQAQPCAPRVPLASVHRTVPPRVPAASTACPRCLSSLAWVPSSRPCCWPRLTSS